MAIDRTQYNALVDDAGNGTSGSVWDKNKVKVVILDPIDALITDPAAFTPTIVSSGGGTPVYVTQVARYDLVNKRVFVNGRVTLSGLGTLAAGTITIGGLPIAASGVASLYSIPSIYWEQLTTAAVHVGGYIAPSAASIQLTIASAATATLQALTKADLSANTSFIFSAHYPVP